MNFDGWTFLKLVELVFVIACLVTKRATDVESYRLFLYLQKISREWKLLRNVTWGSFGSSFADATYGGYVIITSILFITRLIGEIPTHRRVIEYLFLGFGALFFVILGTLELFAIDDLPPDLVDNAIILGTLTLITAGLFLIDMAGPKSVKPIKPAQLRNLQQELERQSSIRVTPGTNNNNSQVTFNLGKNDGKTEKVMITEIKEVQRNGGINGQTGKKGGESKDVVDGGIKKDYGSKRTIQSPKTFGIFGKDLEEMGNSDTDEIDDTIPPKMQQHSPVWSKIRKGQYGRYDVVSPNLMFPKGESEDERSPSGPGDPGFVQYAAKTWGQTGGKTPRHSPTPV
ncbi:uncharacterized protein LOC123681758 isoform X1 [Harmonia axyridis]|uniref:uncharacterized protein LOC123681758 isoform X1 n=1 Tax=Harmonia axyridis TaxID=115357 RepID=UPI001E276A60|nr:uncharacterized protein LOC123681758 isoform X1 [Harmonia axyridis]